MNRLRRRLRFRLTLWNRIVAYRFHVAKYTVVRTLLNLKRCWFVMKRENYQNLQNNATFEGAENFQPLFNRTCLLGILQMVSGWLGLVTSSAHLSGSSGHIQARPGYMLGLIQARPIYTPFQMRLIRVAFIMLSMDTLWDVWDK